MSTPLQDLDDLPEYDDEGQDFEAEDYDVPPWLAEAYLALQGAGEQQEATEVGAMPPDDPQARAGATQSLLRPC